MILPTLRKSLALAKPHFLYKPQFLFSLPFSLSSSLSFNDYSSSLSLPRFTSSSTSASLPSIVTVLMDYVGLSMESAMNASSCLLHLKTTEKPLSVINFLKKSDFSDTHVQTIICKRPQLLKANVEKTLKPKFRAFHDLGLLGCDLGHIISADPVILTKSTEKQILPKLEFLKNYLHTNEKVVRALKKSSWILIFDIEKRLVPNIRLLESYGVEDSQLHKLLLRQPRFFTKEPKRFKEIAERVKEMGFDPNSGLFSNAILAMSWLSRETWQAKVELCKNFGWSEEDVICAFRRSPYLFSLSEKKLKMGMDYFINVLKLDKFYLVLHPVLFSLSLEGRVIPRHRVLQALRSKNLLKKDVEFTSFCKRAENVFLQRYVLSFGNEAEYLLRVYKGITEN
ncbi:uncharacterized protein LOC18432558 [Amborella trichopoda]|nr:uncharacterized protein LOC18432558 [Amborella trichopoda]|eukprot:XP_006842722.2 uncharacterized protein LOC18432558 [Amborella trichopoda]